jgi:hypothetical protein
METLEDGEFFEDAARAPNLVAAGAKGASGE